MRGIGILILFVVTVAGQGNIEDDVPLIIEELWNRIPKIFDDYVTIDDLVNYFCRYDPRDECLNSFRVNEIEFAEGWQRDFEGVSFELAVALFKRFHTTRLNVGRTDEVLTVLDLSEYILYLDLDGDLSLSYLEFTLGLSLLQKDLLWGVMFVRYRTVPEGRVVNYDDYVIGNRTGEGWDRLFGDIDENDNESLEQIEFISFMELGGYSGPITALSWHDQLDTEGEDGERDGLVSYEEWYNAFDRLNYAAPDDSLDYDDFVWLDRIVSPIAMNFKDLKNHYFGNTGK